MLANLENTSLNLYKLSLTSLETLFEAPRALKLLEFAHALGLGTAVRTLVIKFTRQPGQLSRPGKE
jgi:hypothetical protein